MHMVKWIINPSIITHESQIMESSTQEYLVTKQSRWKIKVTNKQIQNHKTIPDRAGKADLLGLKKHSLYILKEL